MEELSEASEGRLSDESLVVSVACEKDSIVSVTLEMLSEVSTVTLFVSEEVVEMESEAWLDDFSAVAVRRLSPETVSDVREVADAREVMVDPLEAVKGVDEGRVEEEGRGAKDASAPVNVVF